MAGHAPAPSPGCGTGRASLAGRCSRRRPAVGGSSPLAGDDPTTTGRVRNGLTRVAGSGGRGDRAEVVAARVAGSSRGATTRRGDGNARARFDENSPGPDRRLGPGAVRRLPPTGGRGRPRDSPISSIPLQWMIRSCTERTDSCGALTGTPAETAARRRWCHSARPIEAALPVPGVAVAVALAGLFSAVSHTQEQARATMQASAAQDEPPAFLDDHRVGPGRSGARLDPRRAGRLVEQRPREAAPVLGVPVHVDVDGVAQRSPSGPP